MNIERNENETEFDYHKRLIYGKLVDKTLSDMDYGELAEAVYGQAYSPDVARRMMYGSCKTLALMESEQAGSLGKLDMDEYDRKIIELKKERQKLFDQRVAFTKEVRERARQEELNEILIKSVESGSLPRLNYEPHEIEPSDNDLLVSLNDIHYGAIVDNYWNKYNSDICSSMMSRYIDRIVAIAKTHRSENCVVWANGDEISGNIHYSIAVTNKENVIEQIKGVSELISEFLAELSKHFRSVSFVSVAGNHSRINPSKDKTITSERLDDLVEWYLGARLQNFDNIQIGVCEKVDSTMYLIDIRGKCYCGVHGDFDGSASKIQALQTMARRPIYAVLSGHLHHCKTDDVQGIKTVMAGSFLGMDDYCVEKRIFGKPEQMVCVCNSDGILCSYNIPLQ